MLGTEDLEASTRLDQNENRGIPPEAAFVEDVRRLEARAVASGPAEELDRPQVMTIKWS